MMRQRIYFNAEKVAVTSNLIRIRKLTLPVGEIVAARCERLRILWLWPLPLSRYHLVLTTTEGTELRPFRHRNAYFVFQLVNAIQSAIDDAQQCAPLAEKSSA